MNGAFVKKAGEQKPEQVDGDGSDGGFGGQVLAVEVINATHSRVGNDQLIGELGDRDVHSEDYRIKIA